MNNIPKSERRHIVFVGRRNVGKSSLVNAFSGQELSIVSDVAGTTTDPVRKGMELLPYGPIVLVDTAGIDDEGELGGKRIDKTLKAIASADFAIFVLDGREKLCSEEKELFRHLTKISLPFVVAVNKIEFGVNLELIGELKFLGVTHFEVSCKENVGLDILKAKVIHLLPNETESLLIRDLVRPGDVVVLVVPIDFGAPKGSINITPGSDY